MRMCFSKAKFLLLTILITVTSVFAQENIISSVTISKANDNINAYELNIDSTEAADYKMSKEDEKSVYFDLKNAVLAEDSATYYNDVTNIDSVVVKQIGHNKVRIYLQGKNVKNTKIVFSNSLVENNQIPAKKITINRPMNEYVPISNIEYEGSDNIQEWDDNSFNFGQFMASLRDGTAGIAITFLLIFLIVAGAIKTLSKKMSQDAEPLIGLKYPKYDVNNELSKKPQEVQTPIQVNNMESITKRAQALQNAQNELAKAHQKYQQYLQNKYNDTPKKQYTSDSIRKGIALNQYQKSSNNPYKNQEVIRLNHQNETNNYSGNFQIPPRSNIKSNMQNTMQALKTRPAVQKNTSPYIQRKPNYQERPKAYTKPDNMKFLESVTKIYEQSGRADLADELKNSITKAKRI